ncbi:MAG: hypothetical protein MZV63_46820 [Marinilabiliales bacterium]|nr:hypothetical protein [Marinilabiliales bacterium]
MYITGTRDEEQFITGHTDFRTVTWPRSAWSMGNLPTSTACTAGWIASRPVSEHRPSGDRSRLGAISFRRRGGPHLFVSFRNPDGTWSEAIDLSGHGLDPHGKSAKISPDGKYLFFGTNGDIYWVASALIEDLRPRPACPHLHPENGPSNPEGDVWYLGHYGYAVKTENKLLIFDYVKKPMPRGRSRPSPSPTRPVQRLDQSREINDLDVVVFVSHNHSDHYDEVIRTWEKTVKKIQYVFGWDVGAGPNVHSCPCRPRRNSTVWKSRP